MIFSLGLRVQFKKFAFSKCGLTLDRLSDNWNLIIYNMHF
jgi:hypothetical protein